MKINYPKIISTVLLTGLIFSFSSCELKETTFTSLPMSNYFRSTDDFKFYLNGVYSRLVIDYTWGGAAVACMTFDDDDTQAGRTYRPGTDGLYNFTTRSANVWNGFFELVQQSNVFLNALENYGDILTPEMYNRYKGEALFLRAYAYLELARRFGGIPLRDGPYLDGISNADCARTSQLQVYERVASDLQQAIPLLPTGYKNNTGYNDTDRGRPTRQAAWGFLMKTGLHLVGAEGYGNKSKNPDEAKSVEWYHTIVRAGDSIMKYASSTSFPILEQKYMTPFDAETQNTCNEILFSAQLLTNVAGRGTELAFTLCPPGERILCGWADNGGGEVSLRCDFIYRKFYAQDKRVEWGVALVDSFYNDKSGEKRWYYTYSPYVRPDATTKSGSVPLGFVANTSYASWWNGTGPGTPNVPVRDNTGYGYESSIDMRWMGVSSNPTRRATPKIYSKKYTDRKAVGKQSNGCDILLLRYADVLLMYAEAKTELNDLINGVKYLDQIRDRAGIPLIRTIYPGIDQEDLRDSIRLERRRELYLEYNRRWDLIRWGEFKPVMDMAKRPRFEWQNLYPIPIAEISANKLIENNNPGW